MDHITTKPVLLIKLDTFSCLLLSQHALGAYSHWPSLFALYAIQNISYKSGLFLVICCSVRGLIFLIVRISFTTVLVRQIYKSIPQIIAVGFVWQGSINDLQPPNSSCLSAVNYLELFVYRNGSHSFISTSKCSFLVFPSHS